MKCYLDLVKVENLLHLMFDLLKAGHLALKILAVLTRNLILNYRFLHSLSRSDISITAYADSGRLSE